MLNNEPKFQDLRDQLAMSYPYPDKSEIDWRMRLDLEANPHNDGPPKPPRRSVHAIVSDIRYGHADEVLTRQYGRLYVDWLAENGYRKAHGVILYTDGLWGDHPATNP